MKTDKIHYRLKTVKSYAVLAAIMRSNYYLDKARKNLSLIQVSLRLKKNKTITLKKIA